MAKSESIKSTKPSKTLSRKMIEPILNSLDIEINGGRPWDIQIHNEKFFQRVLNDGSLGLGESYMDHWWDCDRVDTFIDKLLRAKLDESAHIPLRYKLKFFLAKLINFQTKKLSKEVAYKHYNLGNSLFATMLDSRMIYSCGYWKTAQNLEEAQEAKLELICQKLQLAKGQRVLDIGCGWGGLAKYAAEKYQVEVVGVTISKDQYEYAQKICQGLPIEIRLQDYRDVNEKFDRVVSVGMFEHVGHLNYKLFMQTVARALNDDGLFVLHTIGSNQTTFSANEWIGKYIFPNGMLPSIQLIAKATEKIFVMEDWHNFGIYYDKTLMTWYENFTRHWSELKSQYDERFYRMWVFYLLSCAGGFRARLNQLWQIVFSKRGAISEYIAPR